MKLSHYCLLMAVLIIVTVLLGIKVMKDRSARERAAATGNQSDAVIEQVPVEDDKYTRSNLSSGPVVQTNTGSGAIVVTGRVNPVYN
jgi:hypothetical protein